MHGAELIYKTNFMQHPLGTLNNYIKFQEATTKTLFEKIICGEFEEMRRLRSYLGMPDNISLVLKRSKELSCLWKSSS